MADDTTRPATSGGDIIRSIDIVEDKVQAMQLVAPRGDGTVGVVSRRYPMLAQDARSWQNVMDAFCRRDKALEALVERRLHRRQGGAAATSNQGFSGGSFSLFSIAGMLGYWDPAFSTVVSGLATVVSDRSGNGSDLIKVGASGPVFNAGDSTFNGRPFVGDTVANRRMQVTFGVAIAQPATWYYVIDQRSHATGTFWNSNAGNFTDSHGFKINNSGGTALMLVLDGGTGITTAASFGTGKKVVCCVYAGNTADSQIYSNDSVTPFGGFPGDGGLDGNSAAVFTIGSFTALTYNWAAALVYSGAHNPTQRKSVMKNLGDTFGIATT